MQLQLRFLDKSLLADRAFMREMAFVFVHMIEHRILPHLYDAADRTYKCPTLITNVDAAGLLRRGGYGGGHFVIGLLPSAWTARKFNFSLGRFWSGNKNYCFFRDTT